MPTTMSVRLRLQCVMHMLGAGTLGDRRMHRLGCVHAAAVSTAASKSVVGQRCAVRCGRLYTTYPHDHIT